MKLTETSIKRSCNNCAHNISLICDIDNYRVSKLCDFWESKSELRMKQERALRINR